MWITMIVECPGCRSRYDVTGRPPGTQARCRCGTVFALPSPGEQVEKLSCPQCAAPVPPTNHTCAHCGTQLLVRACPRCFARVFHGAKHCSECGAETAIPAAAGPDGTASRRQCPRCDQPLTAQLVGDVLLDQCDACTGVFVDTAALERILTERRQARADAVLGALPAAAETEGPAQPPQQLYIKCPDCGTVMNRRGFAKGAKVIIDVCRAHGTWFDAGELPKVIAFAMGGGLERAAAAEAQQKHEQARKQEVDRRTKEITRANVPPEHDTGRLAAFVDVLETLIWWT